MVLVSVCECVSFGASKIVKALQGLGRLDVSVKLRRQRFSGSMV